MQRSSLSEGARAVGRWITKYKFLFVVFLLAATEIVAIVARGADVVSSPEADFASQLSAIALIVLFWLNVGCLWDAYTWGAGRIVAHVSRPLRPWLAVLTGFPIGVCAVLYLLIWKFFLRASVFPDVDVLRFSVINWNMLWKYFQQAESDSLPLVMLPAVFVVAAAVAVTAFRVLNSPNVSKDVPRSCAAWLIVAGLFGDLVYIHATATDSMLVSQTGSSRRADARSRLTSSYGICHQLNGGVTLLASLLSPMSAGKLEDIPAEVLVPREPLQTQTSGAATKNLRSCVLIIVESLRPDLVDMTHQGERVMPHLSALAEQSRVFSRFYTQSVHSDYADPCIVSSLYPLRTAQQYFYSSDMPWPRVLLWDALKPRGYATAMISSQNEAWGNMNLFYESENLDLMFDSRSSPSEASTFGDVIFDKWVKESGLAGKLDDGLTRRVAVEWLSAKARQKTPFALVVNFQTSHFPYRLPGGQNGPFAPAEISFPVSLFHYDASHTPIVFNAYCNALHYVDEQIGALIESLEAEGLFGSTLLVVTGDHGEAFNEVGEVGHAQSLLETTTRVPLLLHCPEIMPPAKDGYLAQSIDIAPTILDLLEVPVPSSFQGVSLREESRPPEAGRIVFQHSRAGGTGHDAVVTSDGWRLVLNPESGVLSLKLWPTDLQQEPDLADSQLEVTAILEKTLANWRQRQIAYHQDIKYFGLYCAPRTPELTADDIATLRTAAQAASNRHQAPCTECE